MKYLNNTISKIFSILAVLFLSSSCVKDLNRYPTNDVTNKQVYSNLENINYALAKVYGAWAVSDLDVAGIDDGSSSFVRCFWNLNELPTDEAICAWNDKGIDELNQLTFSSSNPFIEALYYRSIIQIMFANEFLRNVPNAKIDAAVKSQMLAEVRFIRAFQYWVLMDCYANPPFITEKDNVGKLPPKQIQRASLFEFIEKELLDIVEKLPTKANTQYGKVGVNAAYALLARLYLNAEVYVGKEMYKKAAEYAEKVINNGYALVSDYQSLFLADNDKDNTEIILSINFDGKKSQSYGGTTFLVNSAMNGDVKDMLLKKNIKTGINGGWGGNRACFVFGKLFADNKDKRKLFLNNADTYIPKPGSFEKGLHVYKFRNVTKAGQDGSDGTHCDIDFPLFRLAEMYLIYAEAAVRGGGDKAQALIYINNLRKRAYGDDSAALTDITLQNIIDERGRELYWEGFRRTDLIRFDMFTSDKYLWDWKGGTKQEGSAVDKHYEIYPIPASDRNANSKNLIQNPKY